MRAEELTELIRTRPFMPLRIHMTDGHTFDIQHPDQIIVLRSRVDIGVNANRDDVASTGFDQFGMRSFAC